MTVGSTIRSIAYTATGVTTGPFAVPFQFFELSVYLAGALVSPSLYTISQASVGATGSVTFHDSPTGAVKIVGDTAVTQQTDYVENDSFPADTHERALDRLTMIAQELVRLGVRIPKASTDISADLPIPVAGTFLGWADDAKSIVNRTILAASLATGVTGLALLVTSTKSAARDAIGFDAPLILNNDIYFKSGKPWVDVIAFGADPTGGTSSQAAFVAAIAAAQAIPTIAAARVVVPPGLYYLPSGIVIPANVQLHSTGGMGATILHAWHDDVTVVKLNGFNAGIDGFQIYGKGEGNDTGTFGASATTYALHVHSAINGHVRNVLASGGYHAVYCDAADCGFYDVSAKLAYGPSLVKLNSACWYVRCKWDHTATSNYTARPWSARANTTAYVVGDTRTATGPDGGTWGLVCTVAGTSGGSAPTLKNYNLNTTDGTVTWLLLAPVTYSGVWFNGPTVGENSLYQVDLSGPYQYSINFEDDDVGTALVWFTNAICSAPVYIRRGDQIGISQSELTGVVVDTGYVGRFFLHNNVSTGSPWNVDVGANVNTFIITGNDLDTGTITVAAGTSTNYVINDNIRAVIIDGGTGGVKVLNGLRSSSIGYTKGGTVTQPTDKSTGVTINALTGQITTNNAALAAAAEVGFTVTNNQVAAADVVCVCIRSGGTANSYLVGVDAVAAGSFHVVLSNVSAGSLGEALLINFVVIKGATS